MLFREKKPDPGQILGIKGDHCVEAAKTSWCTVGNKSVIPSLFHSDFR